MRSHLLAAITFGALAAFSVGLFALKKCWRKTKSQPKPFPFPNQIIQLEPPSPWKCANVHCDEKTPITKQLLGELRIKMVFGTCNCANYPIICPKCRSVDHKKCPTCAICGKQSNVITLRNKHLKNIDFSKHLDDNIPYISFVRVNPENPEISEEQYYCFFDRHPR